MNGISWELIREQTAGYGDTYIELILLPGDGNLLSFISIPASAATNNSVVSCAALENETILAYSQPAHMIVLVQGIAIQLATVMAQLQDSKMMNQACIKLKFHLYTI